MTCHNPDPLLDDFTSFLVSWEASYSLFGGFSANMTLVNNEGQYTQSSLGRLPITLGMDMSLLACGGCGEIPAAYLNCFSSTYTDNFVSGLISDVSLDEDIETGTVSVAIESYFDRIQRKAVGTEKYTTSDANSVLADVSSTYLGIPPALTDYQAKPNKILGPIEGNNGLEELSRIAQAGHAHLFVQVGGILTAERWKDHNSVVDYYIPQQLINNATKLENSEAGPAIIRLTGKLQSIYDCGGQIITDNRISDTNNGGYTSTGGPLGVCVKTGVSKAGKKVQLGNLKGREEDIKNAGYQIDGLSVERFIKAKDGEVEFNVEGSNAGSGFWLGAGENSFDIVIYGNQRPTYEFTDQYDNKLGRIPYNDNLVNRFVGNIIPAYTYNFPGLSQSNSAYSDEQQEEVITTFVSDAALAIQFGITTEQVDNVYVPCKESLFRIGIRRFQEYKMQRKNWELDMPVLPCLRLNDVIVFETPDREDRPSETIKGIIHSISYSYQADPVQMNMKLGVMSMEDIGTTIYQSGNLIQDICANGDSGNTDSTPSIWTTSTGISLTDEQSDIDGNCFWHFFKAGAVGAIETNLSQGDIDTTGGTLYTLTFDANYVTGSTPIVTDLTITDSMGTLGSVPVPANGSYGTNFTGRASPVGFQWISLPSDPNGYYLEICNLNLMATTIA